MYGMLKKLFIRNSIINISKRNGKNIGVKKMVLSIQSIELTSLFSLKFEM